MRRLRSFVLPTMLISVMIVTIPSSVSAAGPTATTPDGHPIVWSDWISDNAPIAVLLWASWVPNAEQTLGDLDRITSAARTRGVKIVLVVVQEPLKEARDSLEGLGVSWIHDRYGHLLKEYRIVSIPRLLVVGQDGQVVERVELDAESLRVWGDE